MRKFIENLPDTFPGGGFYINKELGAIMPCQPDTGLPDEVRSQVMQKIDILAQELESLISGYGTEGELVTDLKDAIKELNGQTILLLKLYCMESHVIDRGNNDDEREGQEEGEDSRANKAGQAEGSDEEAER